MVHKLFTEHGPNVVAPPPSPNPADSAIDLPNPFSNEYRWTCYNIFKAIVCLIFLVPIRFVIFLIAGLVVVIFSGIGCLVLKEDRKTPPPAVLYVPVRYAVRVIMFSFGYWWVTVKDERKDKKLPLSIIVSNHVSLIDSFFMFYFFGSSVVAKKSVKKIPFVNMVARMAQVIYVDRADPDNRAACRAAILDRANDPAAMPLLIYPEGTTTNGKCLITFRQGAFNPGAPVLPIVMRFPHRYLNPCTRGPGNNPFLLCLQFANFLEVTVLDIYMPSEEEKYSPELYALDVRELIRGRLGIPATQSPEQDAYFLQQPEARE